MSDSESNPSLQATPGYLILGHACSSAAGVARDPPVELRALRVRNHARHCGRTGYRYARVRLGVERNPQGLLRCGLQID